MRKKRISIKERLSDEVILFNNNVIKVSKEVNGELVFETANEATTDLAEGVAILLRMETRISRVWDIDVPSNIDIQPERCLYWLTGGNKEWNTLEHYSKPWSEIYLEFQEEYGLKIIDIIKSSNKLKDIRNKFLKELNLPTLYEFALSRNMIR